MAEYDLPAARTALITGGGSHTGIGRATARRLASAGWAIAIFDRDGDGAKRVAAEMADDHGVDALGLGVDVTDQSAIDEAVRVVEAQLPPIIGLVNGAGVASPTPFLEVTTEEWDRIFDVNMRSAFLVTQRVLPTMIAARAGRITCISSISARRGGGTYSKVPYSAAKAALIGFSRALAREVGEFGITVNCVAPGAVDTEFMGGPLTDETRAVHSSVALIPRMATVEDVSATLAFLLSPDAGYITAATLDVNGGLQIS